MMTGTRSKDAPKNGEVICLLELKKVWLVMSDGGQQWKVQTAQTKLAHALTQQNHDNHVHIYLWII